jgi:hypothetical protein
MKPKNPLIKVRGENRAGKSAYALSLMGARADLCREWLAQKKEIAQLRELLKEATKMDWTWSITQNKKWLAKAEKLMEGK